MRNDVVRSWSDLKEYGIIYLTGEACGIGMRVLCDLTTEGKKLIEEFFGGNVVFTEGSNWNSEGVASVLLPHSLLTDLAAYCVLKNYPIVSTAGNEVRGYTKEKWEEYGQKILDLYRERGNNCRTYQRSGTAMGGTRNVHVMSERVT